MRIKSIISYHIISHYYHINCVGSRFEHSIKCFLPIVCALASTVQSRASTRGWIAMSTLKPFLSYDKNLTIISLNSGFVLLLAMDFYSNFKVTASTTRSLQYANKDRRIRPNLEEVIMLVGYCGKYPRRDLLDTIELSLSHALFPSRCSPRSFSDRDRNAFMTSQTWKSKTTRPTRNNDGKVSLASTNGTTTNDQCP